MLATTIVGVVWIIVMTWICWRGIELSARTQQFLLGMEFVTLVVFAVVALVTVYVNHPHGSVEPSLSWFDPTSIGFTPLINGVLLAVFIYWGWDTCVTVNEETENAGTRARASGDHLDADAAGDLPPGHHRRAGLRWPGPAERDADDIFGGGLGHSVLGSGLDKLLIIAVLSSASASTQTTILPTARTTFAMARAHALPARVRAHPPALPDARLQHDRDGAGIDRVVRGDRQLLEQRARRTRSSRSASPSPSTTG